jgi:hypothetical protein
VFVGRRNYFRISHRTAGLHDRRCAGGGKRIQSVAEGEEGI